MVRESGNIGVAIFNQKGEVIASSGIMPVVFDTQGIMREIRNRKRSIERSIKGDDGRKQFLFLTPVFFDHDGEEIGFIAFNRFLKKDRFLFSSPCLFALFLILGMGLFSLFLSGRLKKMKVKLVAQEGFAAVGKLAAGIAHDLRNPLATMKNSVYLLRVTLLKMKDIPEGEKILQSVNLIDKEIARSNAIITNLLEYARDKKPKLMEIDLNHLLKETLSKVSFPENINFTLKLSPCPLWVKGDDGQLIRCIFNIVNNAIEAMPNGGELTVLTQKNQKYGEVHFIDTGPGIPPENRKRIFEPFFSTKTKGTGLGLTISKKLITAQGGEIAVESGLEKGTRFKVRLPLCAS